MKLLPCKGKCRPSPALATRTGLLCSAGVMLDPTITYLCRRCGRMSTLTSAEFARLPEMTVDQVSADTCDLPWPLPKGEPNPPTS